MVNSSFVYVMQDVKHFLWFGAICNIQSHEGIVFYTPTLSEVSKSLEDKHRIMQLVESGGFPKCFNDRML